MQTIYQDTRQGTARLSFQPMTGPSTKAGRALVSAMQEDGLRKADVARLSRMDVRTATRWIDGSVNPPAYRVEDVQEYNIGHCINPSTSTPYPFCIIGISFVYRCTYAIRSAS